jgi:Uma2 family endonuclease
MVKLELDPDRPWTAEYLEELPDDFRYEVHEGNLVMMAAAMPPWHADTSARIRNLLVRQGRKAYQEQGITLGPGDIRTSDVAEFRDEPDDEAAYHPASAFLLVVEVVSKSSRREDREIKPLRYAEAGIPEYWRVEQERGSREAIVFQYRLVDTEDKLGVYRETRVVALGTLEAELSCAATTT